MTGAILTEWLAILIGAYLRFDLLVGRTPGPRPTPRRPGRSPARRAGPGGTRADQGSAPPEWDKRL